MENKQYPPRGGPPLVYRCRGIPGWRVGWRGFQTAHSVPEGLHVHSFAGIAVGFPEGMAMPNQRKKDAFILAGLQPHFNMRLKPEELLCSILTRQLKQTAMEEKQMAMNKKGHRPGSRIQMVGIRDGTEIHIRDDTALHIRDDTDLRIRDGTRFTIRDGIGVQIPVCRTVRRHATAVRAGYGTGLGSRNATSCQPVHPPEWERYAEKKGKCRTMNNQYPIMKEKTGNVNSGSRKSEVGRWKTEVRSQKSELESCAEGIPLGELETRNSEPETGYIKFSCMKNEF